MKRVGVWVDGAVQAVGFRWWARNDADRLGLTGSAVNLYDGRVELHLQGPDAAVDEMVRRLTGADPDLRRPGYVESSRIERETIVPGERGFTVG